jgi:hypothetical protein
MDIIRTIVRDISFFDNIKIKNIPKKVFEFMNSDTEYFSLLCPDEIDDIWMTERASIACFVLNAIPGDNFLCHEESIISYKIQLVINDKKLPEIWNVNGLVDPIRKLKTMFSRFSSSEDMDEENENEDYEDDIIDAQNAVDSNQKNYVPKLLVNKYGIIDVSNEDWEKAQKILFSENLSDNL